MCGISGILDFSNSARITEGILCEMKNTLTHRGPDISAIWLSNCIGLTHTRLSIIDLSESGNQPMLTNDKRYVIVYNGEVYNFPELRKILEKDNVVFKGNSDTEVVLYSYVKWGISAFKKFNGIFAISIWDNQKQELVLCRDRFGVKPLYFMYLPNGIIFASEIKAILKSGLVKREISPQALHEFAYFGASLGENTMFEGIRKLKPGHFLRYTKKTVEESAFYKLEHTPKVNDDIQTATEKTKKLLEDAVRRQLVSDVPVGIFLSGGIDSSAITAFAAKHYSGRISTYSVGFDFNHDVNELPKARRIAEYYGTNHHELFIHGGNLPPVIEALVKHHDEPFSDAANIPLYLLCQKLEGNPKVVLQGDGGDEIFAGYRRYAILSKFKRWKALSYLNVLIPSFGIDKIYRLKRILNAFAQKSSGLRMASLLTMDTPQKSFVELLNKEWREKLKSTNPFNYYCEVADDLKNLDPVQEMLYTDTKILLPDIFLEKVDKSTMAFSIESRVPFLDNELTEYVLSLPSTIKIRDGNCKNLLKLSLRGIVPDEILDSPKTGFGVPYTNWLKDSLAKYSEEVLNESISRKDSIFDAKKLMQLFEEHKKKTTYQNGFILWKAMNFALWQKFYMP